MACGGTDIVVLDQGLTVHFYLLYFNSLNFKQMTHLENIGSTVQRIFFDPRETEELP